LGTLVKLTLNPPIVAAVLVGADMLIVGAAAPIGLL
jgi:hypothetical protein